MPATIVVVPCYNEAERLEVARFLRFSEANPQIGFVFVNDGSTDGTLPLLERIVAANVGQFRCLDLPQNGGKAEAVRQGVLQALELGAKYVGYWDADLATPLPPIVEFRRVLERRNDIDLVIASRLTLSGRNIHRKRARRVLGGVFAIAASTVLGLRLRDTQCGAKLFRATTDLGRVFSEKFSSRWIFDVEILARMRQCRLARDPADRSAAIYEFPLDDWRDVAGSRLKSSDFVRAFFELAMIYWRNSRPKVFSPHPSSGRRETPPLPKVSAEDEGRRAA